MTFKQTFAKTVLTLKKHSPAIFTGVGVVGLGATAYLAYKSKDKVEAVVERIEDARENGEEVNKLEVAKGLTEALYQPVVVGAASAALIVLAHNIQSKRIKALIGVVAVEQARNLYFEKKYRKEHGDEAFQKFSTPTEEVVDVTVNAKGKEIQTVKEVKMELDKSIGQWYADSSEYCSDDHEYNMQNITAIEEKLQLRLFAKGHITLNEVRDELGFERIRQGAIVGWSSRDVFEITKNVVMAGDVEHGESLEQIWVTWSRPRYIYEEVDFNGRYGI